VFDLAVRIEKRTVRMRDQAADIVYDVRIASLTNFGRDYRLPQVANRVVTDDSSNHVVNLATLRSEQIVIFLGIVFQYRDTDTDFRIVISISSDRKHIWLIFDKLQNLRTRVNGI